MRPYFRLSGGGNDFLALVEPRPAPKAKEIRALCRRGLSAGADGLFLLERRVGGARMLYYNADGHSAELCLNGARCAVRLACHLGWADESLDLETGAGHIAGWLSGETDVTLALAAPGPCRERCLELGGASYSGWLVRVGVPHFVLPWAETLADAPVSGLGAGLRSHEAWGEEGSNIHFVRFASRHRLEIRSYERGVEAETLACGSGVMAAAAAGLARGDLELPVGALTLGGCVLEVDSVAGESADERWSLTGDARLVARGTLLPGALGLPPAPRWS